MPFGPGLHDDLIAAVEEHERAIADLIFHFFAVG